MWDYLKNAGNNILIDISKQIISPPETDQFQINGQLSPNEFRKAGDHLVNVILSLFRFVEAGPGNPLLTLISDPKT
jgi:hypothetical protein